MSKTSACPHPEMNPAQAMKFIEAMTVGVMNAGYMPIPLMIWGQPGIGKSAIIHQIGAKHNRYVIDVRLLLKDPTDLSGLPYYDPESKSLRYSTPADFPDITNPKHAHMLNAIILFDELASAPNTVQAAALQLILDRKIGEYQLPPDVIMIAAGNRAGDGNVFEEMPTPLRNRFAHIDLIASFEQWKKWAEGEKANIHPLVLGYLNHTGDDFNRFDARNLTGIYAFATPRSWERVSEALWSITDKDTLRVEKSMIYTMIGSLVGVDIATKFNAYNETHAEIPLPNDILEGRVKNFDYSVLPARQQQTARYATVLGITHLARERWNSLVIAEASEEEKDTFINTQMMNMFDFLEASMKDDKEFAIVAAERIFQATIPVYKNVERFRPYIESLSGILSDI